jgi:dCMP deaminase
MNRVTIAKNIVIAERDNQFQKDGIAQHVYHVSKDAVNTTRKPSWSKWHKRWMDMACLVATWSKDMSRKVGAVIVDDHQRVVSLGWNGFPRGVNDDVQSRHEKPTKYLYSAHGEQNAISNAAANGARLRGCVIYSTLYPCADCARMIIQSGITKVYTVEPNWDDATYKDSFAAAKIMFAEVGVEVVYVDGFSYTSTKFGATTPEEVSSVG